MKTNLLILTLAAAGALLAGCDKDDDGIRVDRAIDDAFRSRYPDVGRVEWERKIDYYVADFWRDNTESEAWFDGQGVWYMTETDIRYVDLPQAVKTAFAQSQYALWHIEDVDMLEYPDRETVYVIEIEQGKAEYDLYFTPDGVLAKTYPENTGTGNTPGGNSGGGVHQPSTLLPAIKAFIAERYPQARIVDVDRERNTIEVDIVDGHTPREVVFSLTGEWAYTETEVRQIDVPAPVLAAVSASQYGTWRIDDIDHYVTPTGEYYRFELESGPSEVHLKIDPAGNLLP